MSEIKFYPQYNNAVSYETKKPKEQVNTVSAPNISKKPSTEFSSTNSDASKAVYGSVLGGIQYQSYKTEEQQCLSEMMNAIKEKDITKFSQNAQKLDTIKTTPERKRFHAHFFGIMAKTDAVNPEQKEAFLKRAIENSIIDNESRLELANLYFSQGKKNDAKEVISTYFTEDGELLPNLPENINEDREILSRHYGIPPKSTEEIKADIEKIMAK